MGTPLVFTANLPARPTGEQPDGHVGLHQDASDCLAEIRTKLGQLSSLNLSDSTAVGRQLVAAVDDAAARTAIGAGTSSLAIGTTSTTAKAGDYAPNAAAISDATAVGRSVLTAVDAAAVRTAIGAGTSNLAIGTTSTTAKAGDYAPNAAAISDATAVGRTVLTAADAAAARTAIGAGTSNLAIGTTPTTAAAGDHTHPALAAKVDTFTVVGTTSGTYPVARPLNAGRVWFDDPAVTPPAWALDRDRWTAA